MRSPEDCSNRIGRLAEKFNMEYLGYIPYYQNLDTKLDTLDDFISTDFFQKIKEIGSKFRNNFCKKPNR